METSRRKWLKNITLGAAGVGLSSLETFALPPENVVATVTNSTPIRLSSNENPYGPGPMARKAMAEQITASNRYGWDLTGKLRTELARKNHVTESNILLSAGSTEILDLVPAYCAAEKGSLITAIPSYNYWTGAAERTGLKMITVPLTADKKLNLPGMLAAIQGDTRLIYICNPNNPTGTVCERNQLISFIREASKKALILVDEAYIDFSGEESLSTLVQENKNLVIAKTFSKIYGLAGARIGYAIAHSETIERLSNLQCWPNGSVSVISSAAALAALKDQEFVSESYTLNKEVRKFTADQFQSLTLPFIPSETNFLYFSLADYKEDFFKRLKDNDIMGTGIYEENGKWTRITMGTMQEMQKLFQAIR